MAWSNDGALAAGSGCTCEANLAGCVLQAVLRLHAQDWELGGAAGHDGGGQDDGVAGQLAGGGGAVGGGQGRHEGGAHGRLVLHGQGGVVPHLRGGADAQGKTPTLL